MKINEEFKEGCTITIALISVFAMFLLFGVLVEGLFELVIGIIEDYWYIVIIALIGAYIMYRENSK